MTEPTLGDVEDTISDAADVLRVVIAMLSAERVELTPSMRDAVTTTLRLAHSRAAEARELLDTMQGTRR